MVPGEMIESILDAVDHDALFELASDLVKINSVWDPAAGTGEQAAAEHVARWAEKRGFGVQMDQVAEGRPNVIVTWEAGPGRQKLMFEGHTDVVTPGDTSAWQYDPFGAEVKDGVMYGRGANDTKGNLAAMLIAMDAVKRSGVPLSGSIVGGVLCDEEGMMLGVRDFIKRGHADDVTGAIICEPQDGLLCISQKGGVRARFSIRGRMSHGAMPLEGLNTAPALAELIMGLGRLEKEAAAKFGRHRYLGWPSFTPTVVRAPSCGAPQLNVMPGESEILVDIRTVSGQDHDRIRADLEVLAGEVTQKVNSGYRAFDRMLDVDREHGLTVSVEFLDDRPCTETDKNDPVVRAAAWATQKAANTEPAYAGVLGATDGTFLWALKGIPIVTMGAGERHVAHQADEWVSLEQLAQTADIYALAAFRYLCPE